MVNGEVQSLEEIGQQSEGHLSIAEVWCSESRFKPKSPTSIISGVPVTPLKSGLVNGWMWTLQERKIKDDS